MLKDSLFTGVRAVVKMEHRPPSASQRAASTLPVTGEHTAEVREARRACPPSFVGRKRPRRLSEARARPQCMGLTCVPSSSPNLSVTTGANSV